MRSLLTSDFRKQLAKLPERIQQDAKEGFQVWKSDPQRVGWKALVGMKSDLYSVRIGLRYRAVAYVDKEHNAALWLFVGSHEDYNNWVEKRRQFTPTQFNLKAMVERLQPPAPNNPLRERDQESNGGGVRL